MLPDVPPGAPRHRVVVTGAGRTPQRGGERRRARVESGGDDGRGIYAAASSAPTGRAARADGRGARGRRSAAMVAGRTAGDAGRAGGRSAGRAPRHVDARMRTRRIETMSDRLVELRAILADVRARWSRRAFLRAWTLGAATAAAMLLVGLLAVWLVAREGVPLVLAVGRGRRRSPVVSLVVRAAAAAAAAHRSADRALHRRAGRRPRRRARHRGGARREPDRRRSPTCWSRDAVRAARGVDFDRVVSRDTLRRAAIGARARQRRAAGGDRGSSRRRPSRAADVVGSYLFPKRYAIEVTPGRSKCGPASRVTVVGAHSRPRRRPGARCITVGSGDAARSARMTPGADGRRIHHHAEQHHGVVSVRRSSPAPARSAEFRST